MKRKRIGCRGWIGYLKHDTSVVYVGQIEYTH